MNKTLAAALVDFENVYYWLKRTPHAAGTDPTQAIIGIIRALRKHVSEAYNERILSMDAYADFDRIEEGAQSELYLLGVESHNVLGTEHKNAADMRLCIDTLDVLYTRPEIETFILVAGDRDYIPVIQYLKRKAKTVRVVGPRGSVSGDLLQIVGNDFFIDAADLIKLPGPTRQPAEAPAKPGLPAAGREPGAPVDELGHISWEPTERRAIELLHEHFKDKAEVWLTPYLHKLRAEFQEFTEPERKELISRLAKKGVFTVDKRAGTPHDYSVLVMNWNHQLVQSTFPGA